MKIGNVTLNIAPGPSGYSMTPLVLGEFDRTISHELVALNVSTVRTWRLEFFVLDQVDALASLVGTATTFTDYDDAMYSVMVTAFGPVTGYPRAELGRCYVELEEIAPSGWTP